MFLRSGTRPNGYKLRVITGTTFATPFKSEKEDIATETIASDASILRQDVVDAGEWKYCVQLRLVKSRDHFRSVSDDISVLTTRNDHRTRAAVDSFEVPQIS